MRSIKYPLLFMPIPKSGCTSIRNYMFYLDYGYFCGTPDSVMGYITQSGLQDGRDQMADRQGDFVFTFVRHPLRRAYSGFNDKAFHQHTHSFPWLRQKLIRRGATLKNKDPSVEEHRANFVIFLEKVYKDIKNTKNKKVNPHWDSQTRILRRKKKRREIEFIGRLEHMERDFTSVLERAGYQSPFEFRRFNEGPGYPHAYDVVVDASVQDLGRTIFSEDLEELGYEI
ncbi:MAG: sulfotransferase family 2 domain-containing protein [Rhizobiales bacterium]|nr:sulfotransferase family 2 domain-containing protein [Hyphomicrobiales bacterium]